MAWCVRLRWACREEAEEGRGRGELGGLGAAQMGAFRKTRDEGKLVKHRQKILST